MPDNNRRPVELCLPDGREIRLERARMLIRKRISDAKDLFNGDLEYWVEELLHETIEKLWSYLCGKDSRNIREPEKYLLRIARNTCVEAFNRRKKDSEMAPYTLTNYDDEGGPLIELPDESNQPGKALLEQDAVDEIYELITQLPKTSRIIIEGRAKKLGMKEIARMAEIAPDKWDRALQEALQEFQALFDLYNQ